MKMKLLAAVSVGLALATGAPGVHAQAPSELKKVSFLTNYVFHGRHSPFFVGLEKGFYKDAGFEIQISPATGSGFVISAVEGGKADYGMAEAGSVVQAIAKGAKVKGFMVFMDITTSGLASLKPYPKPEDLANATVAASLTDSARVIVPIIFAMRNLDPSTIKWQAADPGIYFSLLLGNQVDLFTASIDGDVPALAKVASRQNKQVHFSGFPEWGYDVFGYLLVSTADRVQQRPEEVKKFSEATARAVRYAMDNPEETARIMVKYNPTLDYDTTLAQWSQSIKAINTDYVKKNGYGAATNDRLQRTIDLVKQALKLDASLTPDQIYTAPR